MSDIRRVNLVIRGRVHGVGFRYYARKCADEFGVTGFVRNLPNGDVETEAEGSAQAVDAFQQAVSKGPSTAHVKEVVALEVPPLKRDVSFEVRMF
jgi:acylphosphatase